MTTQKHTMKKITIHMFFFVLGATIMLLCRGRPCVKPTLVRIDTVRITMPTPIDSTPVKTVTAKLATPRKTAKDQATDTINKKTCDSIEVEVPIVSKEYSDSTTYSVWVSGWRPSLDSIRIYQRQPLPPKPKRWHLGISAGYAAGPRGFSPYVGIGITYSFISL